ncbi:kinase-like protein, partial [Clavulina sp. PMI_390]
KEIMCHRIMGQSPGILRLHHVVEEPDASYLVMDFHPAGDLTTSISTNFHIYEDSRYVKDLSLQIISAIEQCHSKGVYHRDIKPDNILIADGGVRVVVADFGLATNKESTVDFHNGSEIYMSPECLGELHCNNPYRSAPSDVWSLGVVVFCIFMGHPPWMKPSTTDIAFNSFLLDPDYFLRHFPISIQFHRLLRGVFTVNPERRPTLPQFAAALASMD